MAADLVTHVLRHGDRALVLSHRLAEWLTHAPELEEDMALANISLDLLGQARTSTPTPGSSKAVAMTRTTSPTSARGRLPEPLDRRATQR